MASSTPLHSGHVNNSHNVAGIGICNCNEHIYGIRGPYKDVLCPCRHIKTNYVDASACDEEDMCVPVSQLQL